MTPEQLKALFSPLWGESYWQSSLARKAGISRQLVNLYATGKRNITQEREMQFREIALIERGIRLNEIINSGE